MVCINTMEQAAWESHNTFDVNYKITKISMMTDIHLKHQTQMHVYATSVAKSHIL